MLYPSSLQQKMSDIELYYQLAMNEYNRSTA